jgi:hypothetical protein
MPERADFPVRYIGSINLHPDIAGLSRNAAVVLWRHVHFAEERKDIMHLLTLAAIRISSVQEDRMIAEALGKLKAKKASRIKQMRHPGRSREAHQGSEAEGHGKQNIHTLIEG